MASLDSSETLEGYLADTSPVLSSELNGWLSFEIAFQPYVLVALAVMGPLVLQTLAADNAFERSDHSIKCDTSGIYTCDVPVFGAYIDTSALVLYSTSLSVILQIFIFLSFGSMADHGSLRKFFLFFFGFATGLTGLLVLVVVDVKLYWIAFVCVNLSGVWIGASAVFNYAYIPILARYSPTVLEETSREGSTRETIAAAFDIAANQISYLGILYQSLSSLFFFILCAVFVLYLGDGRKYFPESFPTTYPMQITMAFCAAVQLIILLAYSLPRFKSRAGPPLAAGKSYFKESYSSLAKVFGQARQLSDLFKMLIGWFVYSDSFSTVASSAVLFGQSALGANIEILIGAAALVPLFQSIGIWANVKWQNHFSWSTQKILCYQAIFYSLLPLYGILGFFLPPNTFGLTDKYELLATGAYHGFWLGATQSSCRVLFAELIPRGHEAQFFGLYEITDKGSSWIGPLIVGGLTSATGNIRYSFIFLFFSFLVPVYLFSKLDMAKGKRDALEFTRLEDEERDAANEFELGEKK